MNNLPDIFGFYSSSDIRRYHASDMAVALFGHEQIIRCIDLACGHETGAIRHLNADAFPVAGVPQQLLIVRTPDNQTIIALADEEFPVLKAWFDGRR